MSKISGIFGEMAINSITFGKLSIIASFFIKFENFGAFHVAFMLNFPKHPNFFIFLMDFREVMAIQTKVPHFETHTSCRGQTTY